MFVVIYGYSFLFCKISHPIGEKPMHLIIITISPFLINLGCGYIESVSSAVTEVPCACGGVI